MGTIVLVLESVPAGIENVYTLQQDSLFLEHAMIDLYDASTNQLIGSITEADLQVLVDGLEEESSQDQDYYIDRATIDLLADGRATTHLVGLLRSALGSSDGVDIRWQRR